MSSAQNYNRYADALATKRKKYVIKRIALSIFIGASLIVTTVYLLFFTGYLRITEVSINGLRTVAPGEISSLIDSAILQNVDNVFKFIRIQKEKNIIFFNADAAQDKILAKFTVIKSVKIEKEYPHKITLDLAERIPIGTWCFQNNCYYFDEEGVLWGKALKSSGSLLLTVEDSNENISNPSRIEPNLLESIKKIVAGFDTIGLGIKGIEIPVGSIDDIRINTAEEYYVLANTGSDIEKQLDILRIFLKNKGGEIRPAYIDIRIEGRVYYK